MCTMKSRKDGAMVTIFMEVYDELSAKGHKLVLHMPNNKYSKAVKYYITSQQNTHTTGEPHNHHPSPKFQNPTVVQISGTSRNNPEYTEDFVPRQLKVNI